MYYAILIEQQEGTHIFSGNEERTFNKVHFHDKIDFHDKNA